MRDRKECQQVRSEIEEAIQGVLKKHKLEVSKMHAVYGFGSKLTIEFGNVEEDGSVVTKELLSLRNYYPEAENKKFNTQGIEFHVTGFSPRSWKRPFLTKASDGKTYKFSLDHLNSLTDLKLQAKY